MRSGSILLPGGSSGQDAHTTLGFKMDEDISRSLLAKILKQAQVSKDEWEAP